MRAGTAGEQREREADVDRLPVADRREQRGVVADDRHHRLNQCVDPGDGGTGGVGEQRRQGVEIVVGKDDRSRRRRQLPDQPQPAQRQTADEVEKLEVDVERGVAFDRGRDRMTDFGRRQDLVLEQRVPNREMEFGQFVEDEAGGLTSFRGPGDVGLQQLPYLKQRQFAGPVRRLDILGLARPDEHDPQTDVDQPRLAEPGYWRRAGLVGECAQKSPEMIERDVGLLDHRHGLAQMTALRCWQQLLAQDAVENDLRQPVAVSLLESDPERRVACHVASHFGADLNSRSPRTSS